MFGYKLSGGGATAVLAFFFAPWILFSCGNQPIGEFSGYDFASGRIFQEVAQARQFDTNNELVVLWLIPLISIIVLLIVGIGLMRQSAFLDAKLDAFIMMGGAGVQLYFVLSKMLAISSRVNANPSDAALAGTFIQVEWRYGLFFSIIGALAVLVGGLLALREERYY